jgi:hypothetical protein
MSKTDLDGDVHLPPDQMMRLRPPWRRHLAVFRKYGYWGGDETLARDLEAGVPFDKAVRAARKRAREDFCDEDFIERHYPPVD